MSDAADPGRLVDRARRIARENRPFLFVLLAATVVRVLVLAAFHNGFIFSDAHTYLRLAQEMRDGEAEPSTVRVVGYSVFLAGLQQVLHTTWSFAAVQHVLGLLTGVLGFALLRRWGVSRRLATWAVVPVLFDGMQLLLEQAILSDVLFDFLLLAGIALLAWRRTPTIPAAAAAGVVLGLTVLVRVSGQPIVLSAVLFCLVAATTWRRRLATSIVLVVAFVAPLIGYATWYQSFTGDFALAQVGGRSLFMRTTTFADCSRFTVPDYEKVLCPKAPVGKRMDPTDYGWHNPDGYAGLTDLPPDVTVDEAMGDFAHRAIRAQPWDYVHTVLRDSVLMFSPVRTDYFDYDTSHKWRFSSYVHPYISSDVRELYDLYGSPYSVNRPLAIFFGGYGWVVILWGPLMLMLMLVGLVGLVRRRAPGPDNRPLVLLTLSISVGLSLLPVITVEFVWRYTLPAVVLTPLAAALAWGRLRPARTPPPDPDPEPRSGRTADPAART